MFFPASEADVCFSLPVRLCSSLPVRQGRTHTPASLASSIKNFLPDFSACGKDDCTQRKEENFTAVTVGL